MKKICAAFLFLLVSFTCPANAAMEKIYHVAPAPRGDDNHDGSAGAPFATLDRARLAVRASLATQHSPDDIVVEVHGGIYEFNAPVHFDAADSGQTGTNVIYHAAPGETVVFSGGRRITGWTRETSGIYRANVGLGVDFRQLWINDRRAIRARTPNPGRMFHFAADKQADGFDLPSDQLKGVAIHSGEIELSILIAWMHKRLRIAKTKPSGDITRVIIVSQEWNAVTQQPQGDRVYLNRGYWLENAREFLDAPGEFFLDRSTGMLRYMPRPDEDMSNAVGVRPDLENLIVLDGRPDAPVHHLGFEGFTFVHTGWTRPNHHGFVDVQANSLVPADLAGSVDAQYRHNQRKDRIPAAFQAATADHILLRGNRFARLGGTGVIFTHGGDDNIIEQNSFYDLAAGGIELGEDAARPTSPRLFPRRNLIANNFLAHIGQDYFGSVPILGYYTDATLITHNEITAVPYTGISQGWGWGAPTGPDEARANRITFNRVTNFMRRLDDGGGIYTTDRQLGSEIAHNYVARMVPPDARTKAGGALYLDQFTEGFHVHDNVVAESLRWLFIWNPNIHGNRVEANYADTAAQRNDGKDNVVEPVHLATASHWPETARAIIAQAGLEPQLARVREIAAPSDVIVESTGVDFQILAGAWTATDQPAGRYSGYCQQSNDPVAAVRWTPVLPKDGVYEVSLWRPAGCAGIVCTLRSADGESRITLSAKTTALATSSQWESLGRFRFKAGADSELVLTSADSRSKLPLLADTARFRAIQPE